MKYIIFVSVFFLLFIGLMASESIAEKNSVSGLRFRRQSNNSGAVGGLLTSLLGGAQNPLLDTQIKLG
uniref:Uncharacterized protein n=1 Tax=Panagrolaimus sp. PS1159 TaxID=55785 RepID=A0AC35FJ34_9BILA